MTVRDVAARLSYPERVGFLSPGSRPRTLGKPHHVCPSYPAGVVQEAAHWALCNPFRVRVWTGLLPTQGARPRPWAAEWNPCGVKTIANAAESRTVIFRSWF